MHKSIIPLLVLLTTQQAASAAELTVDTRSNIYGSGHVSPFDTPEPSGGGGGVPPPSYAFTAPAGAVLRFSEVTGFIDVNFGGPAGPDGHGPATGDPGFVVGAWNGLSEFAASRYACMVGVFLSDAEPVDPAPLPLDYAAITLDFKELSPGLGQVFYIGDGRDGVGNVQDFWVPSGARRLFLGIPDHSGGAEPAGWYDDNTGVLTARFDIIPVPEPGQWGTALSLALSSWPVWRRRRSSCR